MEEFFLQDLINAAKAEFLLGDPHTRVGTISTDTRTLRRGDFYVALAGKNFDGHDFLNQAVEKRAGGLVVSRTDVELGNPFPDFPAVVRVKDTTAALGDIARAYRNKWKVTVAAVTGSNGKTTTKEMLAFILSQKGPTLSTSGNFNNQIGLPLTLFKLESRHEYAVIEMGTSWPGEIARLAGIASPDVGIITNIGSAHLENFKSREGVLAEKRQLLDHLREGGVAVVNGDDPYLSRIAAERSGNTVTYGLGENCDVRATSLRLWPEYPRFTLEIAGTKIEIKLPVFGRFNVYNALAAAAATWKLGIEPALIKTGLENFPAPKMRMETRTLVSGTTIINDAYNANPSSMREAVEGLVQSFPERDKVVVLGDMLELGDEAEREHAKMGEFLATQPLRQIYLFGPLMTQARAQLSDLPARHFATKSELIQELKKSVVPGSVVFFKASRGMKMEEVIEGAFSGEEV